MLSINEFKVTSHTLRAKNDSKRFPLNYGMQEEQK